MAWTMQKEKGHPLIFLPTVDYFYITSPNSRVSSGLQDCLLFVLSSLIVSLEFHWDSVYISCWLRFIGPITDDGPFIGEQFNYSHTLRIICCFLNRNFWTEPVDFSLVGGPFQSEGYPRSEVKGNWRSLPSWKLDEGSSLIESEGGTANSTSDPEFALWWFRFPPKVTSADSEDFFAKAEVLRFRWEYPERKLELIDLVMSKYLLEVVFEGKW